MLDSGAVTPSADGYQYAALTTPVLLLAGATYALVSDQVGYHNGQIYNTWSGAKTPLTNGFNYYAGIPLATVAGSTVTFSNYTFTAPTPYSEGPVNMTYEFVAAPEPSSVALGCIGVAFLASRFRSRKS